MFRTVILASLILCVCTVHCAAENENRSARHSLTEPAEHAANQEPTAADVEFFERRIRPLLIERCYECHSAESETPQGGLLLDTRAGLLKGGDLGPAVLPGSADRSLLIEAVRYDGENVQMPPTGRLPAEEIAELVRWVERDAVFPGSAAAPTDARRTIDFDEGRSFWSFQPVQQHALPAVEDSNWPRGRIDRFLLADMEAVGLRPSLPADRRMLLRRVTFDLIGLPPTPAEFDAFVNDQSPDAYETVVEQLLQSPHHGERWGRFWLDLARYSDTTAKWLYTLKRSYLYRDWVVQALNQDMPYDKFVTRQLATDLMPSTGPDDVPALGFLGLSPTYWKELKLAPNVIESIVAEEWDERIDAVSRSFLGLTVSCARCHDHKFDPISTEDYYGLAGVFASIKLVNRPMVDEQTMASTRAAKKQVAQLERELKAISMDTSSDDSAGADKRIAEIGARIEDIKQATPHYDVPLAHAVAEASLHVQPDGKHRTKLEYKTGEPRDVPVFIRGNPAHRGEVVQRRFLTVLSPGEPEPFQQGSGRRELADAIFNQAGGLAARVIVNRVWKQHFGQGLVETPSNFGVQGARPSHPELLDDLAARFVEAGWSLKWLHREIVLSAAFQQSSSHDRAQAANDPQNRRLWRMNRRRLEIEAWRDATLAVAGLLDSRIGGPAEDLDEAANVRRTIYGTVQRRDVHEMLRLHDFPDPGSHSPARETTTTPLQQLFVLNSPFVQTWAAALARRLQSTDGEGALDEQVSAAYRLLFCRQPSKAELLWARGFLSRANEDQASTTRRWQQYAQVLLASNEFLFVD